MNITNYADIGVHRCMQAYVTGFVSKLIPFIRRYHRFFCIGSCVDNFKCLLTSKDGSLSSDGKFCAYHVFNEYIYIETFYSFNEYTEKEKEFVNKCILIVYYYFCLISSREMNIDPIEFTMSDMKYISRQDAVKRLVDCMRLR